MSIETPICDPNYQGQAGGISAVSEIELAELDNWLSENTCENHKIGYEVPVLDRKSPVLHYAVYCKSYFYDPTDGKIYDPKTSNDKLYKDSELTLRSIKNLVEVKDPLITVAIAKMRLHDALI